MTLNAGDRLGPYEIVDLLGLGEMGEVYRARDTRLDRLVGPPVSRSTWTGRPAHSRATDVDGDRGDGRCTARRRWLVWLPKLA